MAEFSDINDELDPIRINTLLSVERCRLTLSMYHCVPLYNFDCAHSYKPSHCTSCLPQFWQHHTFSSTLSPLVRTSALPRHDRHQDLVFSQAQFLERACFLFLRLCHHPVPTDEVSYAVRYVLCYWFVSCRQEHVDPYPVPCIGEIPHQPSRRHVHFAQWNLSNPAEIENTEFLRRHGYLSSASKTMNYHEESSY